MNLSNRILNGEKRRGFGSALLGLGLAAALAAAAPLAAQDPAPASLAPIQIFLPPLPPPAGAPHPSAAGAPGMHPAPAALAVYVGEPFYAPLSTRLAKSEIGDDLAFRLETFRESRATLLTELRARIDTLKEADSATRVLALEKFAGEQTPRIDALEKEADLIREDLSQRGSGRAEVQEWRRRLATLGHAAVAPALELEIVRMDVFYREGLSPAQRRLLAGIAVKRADRLAPPALAPGENAGSLLYFLPETARICLPTHLPSAVAEKIVAFLKERKSLEDELTDALYGPAATSAAARVAALQALAIAENPRLTALEAVAEEIRRGLALLNDPARPPELPELPPALLARITAYRIEKSALNKALFARREAAMKSNPSLDSAALEEKIRQAIAAFSAENAARLTALDQSKDAIRADLARLPGAGAGSADALLAKNSDSLRRLQTAWDYRDYQTAVLQPGLSPEQRRLLFASALEKLGLPLPGGEIQAGLP